MSMDTAHVLYINEPVLHYECDTCDVTLANALSFSTVTNTNKYYLISPTYLTITTLPSNLRKTNCECAYLVRRGYFRSRDKDGGHTTRSAMVKCTQISWL